MISLGPNGVNGIDCSNMKPEENLKESFDWNIFSLESDFNLLKDLFKEQFLNSWGPPCLKVGKGYNEVAWDKSSGSYCIIPDSGNTFDDIKWINIQPKTLLYICADETVEALFDCDLPQVKF